jgi:hypothetical protein
MLLPPPPPPLVPPPLPPPLPPPPELPPEFGPRPPSLYNQAIENDEYINQAAFRLYERFFGALEKFVELQSELTQRRVRFQEKRQELKRLRDSISESDAKFLDHVRRCKADGTLFSSLTEIEKLFESCQHARDRIGPIEVEYEPMEVDLG